MSTKFKLNGKAATNALYIGAALLIVAIICVSIVAAVNQSRKTDKGTLPKVTSTDVTSQKAPTTNAPITTNNSGSVTPPVTSDSINTGVETPTEQIFTEPTSTGSIIKGHATDLFVYSVTMNDYRIHTGIDISASVGDGVYSVSDGTVKQVYTDPLMGVCVAIDHGNGIVSYYMNLSETLPETVKEGAYVSGGQLIASVGESAAVEISDEAHLHFEMTKDNLPVDPLDYVSYEVKSGEDNN